MTTFSRTVSSMSSVSSCGTTPRRPRIFTPSRVGSSPNTLSVPSETGETHPIMRMVDVFPAPFGPRKPNASPRWRSKSIPSTATKSPKRFTRPRAWISGCPFWLTDSTLVIDLRPPCALGVRDVAGDLLHEGVLALEDRLVPEALPQLDHEAPSVQVAVEVEEIRLDAPLRAAVVRVRADGDRGSVAEAESRVDPVPRAREVRLQAQVRRRVAERPSTLVARDDDTVELERPAEHARCGHDVTLRQRGSDRRRRDAGQLRHHHDLESEPLQEREIAGSTDAEVEVRAGHHNLDADGAQVPRRELPRRELLQLGREGGDEDILDAGLADQLEPASERGKQLDLVAERDARVRIERHDRRQEAGRAHRVDHGAMAAVHAVEAPDGGRTRRPRELRRRPRDAHSSLDSASSGSMIRSGSASSTRNGPISVRRRDAQWPPRTSAMART